MRKRCQSCGTAFDAKRSTALYCGSTCRTRETRKRAAGRPDAVQAARPATTPVTVRTVTVMLAPGVTVDVEPEVASKLAAHLPFPGERVPFSEDVRPRFLQEREAGIEAWEREQAEAAEQAAREEAERRLTDLLTDQLPTPEGTTLDVTVQLPAGQPVDLAAPDAGAQLLRRGRGLVTAEDVAEARAQRDAEHEQARREADEAIEQVSVVAATLRELKAAKAELTALGRNALVLAEMLDQPYKHTGSALASLSREWRATLASALNSGEAEDDPLTAARKAREARIAAAQAQANSGAV